MASGRWAFDWKAFLFCIWNCLVSISDSISNVSKYSYSTSVSSFLDPWNSALQFNYTQGHDIFHTYKTMAFLLVTWNVCTRNWIQHKCLEGYQINYQFISQSYWKTNLAKKSFSKYVWNIVNTSWIMFIVGDFFLNRACHAGIMAQCGTLLCTFIFNASELFSEPMQLFHFTVTKTRHTSLGKILLWKTVNSGVHRINCAMEILLPSFNYTPWWEADIPPMHFSNGTQYYIKEILIIRSYFTSSFMLLWSFFI